MEGFKVHPDVELLASIYRELSDNLREAVQMGGNIENVLADSNIDALSFLKFTEALVTRAGRMMQQIHPEGAPCEHTMDFWHGMYMEAFVMGTRYAAEKNEWAKARSGGAATPEQPS